MSDRSIVQSEKHSRVSLVTDGEATPIDVLLVEDSKTVRAQLRQYIALLEKVTLLDAETLADARAILESRSRELFCAIVDLTLPDATGLNVVETVGAYDVPIIVLTGSLRSRVTPHVESGLTHPTAQPTPSVFVCVASVDDPVRATDRFE